MGLLSARINRRLSENMAISYYSSSLCFFFFVDCTGMSAILALKKVIVKYDKLRSLFDERNKEKWICQKKRRKMKLLYRRNFFKCEKVICMTMYSEFFLKFI